MNILNEKFSCVFLVTTVNSERLSNIINHLEYYNILFDIQISPDYNIITDSIKSKEGGYDEWRPSISLLSSYVSIFEKSKIKNYNDICIIEDDLLFEEDWEYNLEETFKNTPLGWDIINFGYDPINYNDDIKYNKINEYVSVPLNWYHTTHITSISGRVFDDFIKKISNNYSKPIDYFYMDFYRNTNYKCYVSNKIIARQRSYRDKKEPHQIFKSTLMV